MEDAGKLVGNWRLRRCLGHLAAPIGAGTVPVAAAPKRKRKNKRSKGQEESTGSSSGKGKSKSRSKSTGAKVASRSSKRQSKSKSKGRGKGKRSKGKSESKRKSMKNAQQTGSDDVAPVGQVVGTIPPSAPRAGGPARPWQSGDQAQKVAETSEWLKQQREKLGLDGGGFDVETLKKKKAERMKKGIKRKPGEEDPLIAKLKAMGETRLTDTESKPHKGKL